MTMTGNGLAKLIEECGELTAVAGKRLAYYHTDTHPDGGPPLSERLEDEIADAMAAVKLVIELHDLDTTRIAERLAAKLELFRRWHADPSNNTEGIQVEEPAPTPEVTIGLFALGMRRSRQAIEITQAQLGVLTGLQRSAISHFETGKRSPSLRNLRKIAAALGVSIDSILMETP